VYFTPASTKDKVNSIFSSLHFERIPISSTLLDEQRPGSPADIFKYWQDRLLETNTNIRELTQANLEVLEGDRAELAAACLKVRELYHTHDVKKYAAITSKGNYMFVGWMVKKDALALEQELHEDELTFFSRSGETGEHPIDETPPTRLKNPPVIRLFEFFTRMYGMPVYGELDPTPVMAITYTLLFGLMFGDVGQGICIALLGYYLYKIKKADLGGIIAVVGVSATVFGFLYGSIFGLEDILPALWRRPADDINGMLMFAVGVGVAIIFLSMVLHIINTIRQRRWAELFFSPNGAAGITFYSIILWLVLRVALYGYSLTGAYVALACLPLVFVAFREPLTRIMTKERPVIDGSLGMFLFSTTLELMEVLLTYVTNTISFVRVGAFAISHAGMMSVVLLLSHTAAGTHNILVLVLGNIVVTGIEGLLVGIQVLRLDFYEVLSRFYRGSGQIFLPAGTEKR
jgi:V/A-type H+-transporting ATPase subunit I